MFHLQTLLTAKKKYLKIDYRNSILMRQHVNLMDVNGLQFTIAAILHYTGKDAGEYFVNIMLRVLKIQKRVTN